MRNEKLVLGVVVLLVGLFLLVGFWPLFAHDGRELLAAREGNGYAGYAPGDGILFRGRATDVTFVADNPLFGAVTFVTVEDGDPDEETIIVIRGDARGRVAEGRDFFAGLTLREGRVFSLFVIEYWEAAGPEAVQSPLLVDGFFAGLVLLGAALVLLGRLEARRG